MDLRRSNRKKVNSTTDECPDDRTVNADILKVAAEDQFETVGNGPRIPVPHDLSDEQSDLTTPLKQLCNCGTGGNSMSIEVMGSLGSCISAMYGTELSWGFYQLKLR